MVFKVISCKKIIETQFTAVLAKIFKMFDPTIKEK